MNELRLNASYYRPEYLDFRETVRRFVAREIAPHVNDWDKAESFPRDLYRKAADVGLLGLGFPEEYGGIAGTDTFHRLDRERRTRPVRLGRSGRLADVAHDRRPRWSPCSVVRN